MAAAAVSKDIKSYLSSLQEMRDVGGAPQCTGLVDNTIRQFLAGHPALSLAIERAYARFLDLKASHPDFVDLDEASQVQTAHAGLTNFYAESDKVTVDDVLKDLIKERPAPRES